MSSHQPNYSLYSTRAKNLLQHPRFLHKTDKQEALHWHLEYQEYLEYSGELHQLQTDKILTLKVSQSATDDLQTIILESICVLAQGKTLLHLFSLSFRELENFLRDENHMRAFAGEIEIQAAEIFEKVKISLLVHVLASRIVLPAPWARPKFSWSKLTLVEKNRAAQALMSALRALFPQGKLLELVLAEEATVTVKKNDFPLDLTVIEGLMGHLFSCDTADSPLKVVGTL